MFLEPSIFTAPPLLNQGEQTKKEQKELSCILCGKLRDSKPIFATKGDLKKHILLHKAFSIMENMKAGNKKANRAKVTSFPAPCVFCSKTTLINWEQAVLHVGIDHDKLFHALKHRDQSKHTNDEVLMKEFYPAKFEDECRRKASNKMKKKSNQVEELIPDGEAAAESFSKQNSEGRLHSGGRDNLSKAAKEDQERSGEQRMGILDQKKRSAGDQPKLQAKRACSAFSCSICSELVGNPSKYSTKEQLQGHMAESHFLEWILQKHPTEEGSTMCR